MRVIAIPKEEARRIKPMIKGQSMVAMISILDYHGCSDRIIEDNEMGDRGITLWFDDIHPTTTMTLASCMDCKAMAFEDAKSIVRFVKNIPSTVDTIFVHCTAGICRSGAVADFLRVVLDCDDIRFAIDNPHILPNEWVRDLLWQTWKFDNV
jgi:predicted protein tyrosine phosphatase